MPLIHATDFMEIFGQYRVCAIVGPVGVGKTMLSIAMADHLYTHGDIDGVWATFPHTLPDLHKMYRVCFLLDEASKFGDARASATNLKMDYGRNVRKTSCFFVGATVNEPDKRMRHIRVCRMFRLLFLDWIFYKWELFDSSTRGWFVLTGTRSYWGTYDTKFIVEHDNGIARAFAELDAIHDEQCPNGCGHNLFTEAFPNIFDSLHESRESGH